MKYITLPADGGPFRPLSFYLSMEEYVASHVAEPDSFFLWQVEPSVIFGRNQVMQNEVNTAYCRQNGIRVFQRKSGGGCVYADEGNIMLSYITNDNSVPVVFNRFLGFVLLVLRRMGIDAVSTTHNDVLIGGLKVSGSAMRLLSGHTIAHSTLLYDTNMEHMTNAITPPPEKLQAKGIESVRQRITLLKDHTSLSLEQVKTAIRETLCQGELALTQADVKAIEAIAADRYTIM
ncbi:MAG: lipoate--protein ligase family protein [Prevotella sp.]|nr:lipoate--protein ligase family protein [Prevotella sp.]